jgi:hypothetical protein
MVYGSTLSHREYCDLMLFGLHIMFVTSTIPGMTMRYSPRLASRPYFGVRG